MSRRRKQNGLRWNPAGVILIAGALIGGGLSARVVLAQLDLSVFQKEGASEEQQSQERYECHKFAVERTGFDPAVRPSDDYPPMRSEEKAELKAEQQVEWRKQQVKYIEVVKRCMEQRGYRMVDH